MKATDKDVVAAIAQEVAAQVGELRYNLWFRDNAKLTLTDHELVVGVPNLFFQEWLSSNFLLTLRRATETVTGRRLAVRLVVNGELFRAMRAREPSAPAATPSYRATAVRNQQKLPTGQTLENFVVGDSNRLAHAAALEVAQSPTGQFNPLVFYGPLGLGKTHLLRGIGHSVGRQHAGLEVVYMTAEAFTNSFLEGMRTDRLGPFRRRVREADLLLIDDIHFLASKRATQAEVLHTCETLDSGGKQVVMAADRHPSQILECCPELRNRLIAGMACPLEPPEYQTRFALLERKARALNLAVSANALEFIATHLRANVRELFGAVNCLKAHAGVSRSAIDLITARQVLAGILDELCRSVSLKEIERAVSQTLEVSTQQLRSGCRSRAVSHPRMLAMYLARKYTGVPYDAIGQYFGGRNHSTAMFAERKVQHWLEEGATLKLAGQSWPVTEALRLIERRLQ